jgi:hypothetical protein
MFPLFTRMPSEERKKGGEYSPLSPLHRKRKKGGEEPPLSLSSGKEEGRYKKPPYRPQERSPAS